MNLFSIIIPLYNREVLILEALESVKTQTYRPIELIIVDDGSTDGTAKAVRQWATAEIESPGAKDYVRQISANKHDLVTPAWEIGDDFFKVRYFSQKKAGAGAARNLGVQQLRGEYVQFLDSDDRIHPNRLQRLVEIFEKKQYDFIQTGFEGFDAETGEVISTHYGREGEPLVEQALRGVLWANTLRSALTRDLVKKLDPWNTEMSCFEDREYMERAVVNAENPVVIRNVLASARRGGRARVSDKMRSYEGRTWRIYCEQCLANATRDRGHVSYASKQAFSSRLYALGFRCNAKGWSDLGKHCGKIAESMNVKLDSLGRRRRLVWRMGRVGAVFYDILSRLKRFNWMSSQ